MRQTQGLHFSMHIDVICNGEFVFPHLWGHLYEYISLISG